MNATSGHIHVPQAHIHGQGRPASTFPLLQRITGPEVARTE